MKIPIGVLAGSLLSALVIACSPTTLCGCSPPVPNRIVEGTVRTESGALLPDVTIRARALLVDCTPVGNVHEASTTSGTDGRYELWVYAEALGSEVCVELMAVRSSGATADTLVSELVTEVSLAELPPVTVDFVFPG